MRALPLIVGCLISIVLIGQDDIANESCSIAVVREMKSETNESTILRFLKTYSVNCSNNAEFRQVANWNLFYILANYPILTISTLSKAEEKYELTIDHIVENFGYPISDDIDIESICKTVENGPASEMKDRVLKKLKNALGK